MIAYFTASIEPKPALLESYKQIISFYTQKNHKIISDHIVKDIGSLPRTATTEERIQFLNQVETWIHTADFVIAECTTGSISVGYEICLALRVGKPVLMLYQGNKKPVLQGYHRQEKLFLEKYTGKTLPQLLENFEKYVKGHHELKFTFFAKPSIISYLDTIAAEKKIPKSVYLRNLIEADMKRNSF